VPKPLSKVPSSLKLPQSTTLSLHKRLQPSLFDQLFLSIPFWFLNELLVDMKIKVEAKEKMSVFRGHRT